MTTRRIRPLAFVVMLAGAVAACGTQDTTDSAQRAQAGGTVTLDVRPTPSTTPPVTSPTASLSVDPNTPTSVIAPDAACDALITSDLVLFETLNDLIWSSNQVVIGTVAERLAPEKIVIEGSALPFTIVTDIIVHVDQRFRGHPLETITIRTPGGRIGECAQEYPDLPILEEGETAVLFVREPDVSGNADVFEYVGGRQGFMSVGADGQIDTRNVYFLQDQPSMPVETLAAAITAELVAGPSPNSDALEEFLVPESEAPISVPSEATPVAP